MRVVICDDDIYQLEIIKSAMDDYALKHMEKNYTIECFKNPIELLESSEKTGGYDILILDICMPGIMGIDIAREIRNKNDKNEIIFLTSSKDYAVEAFELKAAHYIVKPFKQNQLDEALNRAMESLKSKQIKNIAIKMRNGNLRSVELSEILYIESFRHSQIVYLKDGENIEARETLTKILTLIEKEYKGQFISPYKGFIVNQKSIREIKPNKIILKNGKEIPIGKRNFTTIKQQYFDFMFMKEA